MLLTPALQPEASIVTELLLMTEASEMPSNADESAEPPAATDAILVERLSTITSFSDSAVRPAAPVCREGSVTASSSRVSMAIARFTHSGSAASCSAVGGGGGSSADEGGPSVHEGFVYKKVVARAGTLLATAMPSTTYRHLRLKPLGTMLMCTNAGTDAEERGRLHLDASSSVQIVDETSGGSGGGGSRRPAFRLIVANYKGKTHKEPIEFQCDTSRELQAWVRAIEEVIAALRSADMISRSPRSSQTLVAGMI